MNNQAPRFWGSRSEWLLRLGIGLMYLYSGYNLIVNPLLWYGYLPRWFSQIVTQVASVDAYLRLQGIGELAMGLLFLTPFFGRWSLRLVSAAATVEMALIILFVGVDPITFRDIGLLGAAAALAVMSWEKPTEEEMIKVKQIKTNHE